MGPNENGQSQFLSHTSVMALVLLSSKRHDICGKNDPFCNGFMTAYIRSAAVVVQTHPWLSSVIWGDKTDLTASP